MPSNPIYKRELVLKKGHIKRTVYSTTPFKGQGHTITTPKGRRVKIRSQKSRAVLPEWKEVAVQAVRRLRKNRP